MPSDWWVHLLRALLEEERGEVSGGATYAPGLATRIRRLLGLLGLLILLGLVAACSATTAASGPNVTPAPRVDGYTGGPRLALDNQSIDYGSVPYNKEVKANFQVKNVGDRRLTVKKVDVKAVQGC